MGMYRVNSFYEIHKYKKNTWKCFFPLGKVKQKAAKLYIMILAYDVCLT